MGYGRCRACWKPRTQRGPPASLRSAASARRGPRSAVPTGACKTAPGPPPRPPPPPTLAVSHTSHSPGDESYTLIGKNRTPLGWVTFQPLAWVSYRALPAHAPTGPDVLAAARSNVGVSRPHFMPPLPTSEANLLQLVMYQRRLYTRVRPMQAEELSITEGSLADGLARPLRSAARRRPRLQRARTSIDGYEGANDSTNGSGIGHQANRTRRSISEGDTRRAALQDRQRAHHQCTIASDSTRQRPWCDHSKLLYSGLLHWRRRADSNRRIRVLQTRHGVY